MRDQTERLRDIRQAIEQHTATLLAHGQLIPQDDRLVHVEELTVRIRDSLSEAEQQTC